jgi:hypothetical protein
MGKIIDFLLTNSWEEYQRVQLYKTIGEAAKNLSKEQLVELKKMMDKVNSKLTK